MKYLLIALLLVGCDCCKVETDGPTTVITKVGNCTLYRVPMKSTRDIFTTICPNGNSTTQYQVPAGKSSYRENVETVNQ